MGAAGGTTVAMGAVSVNVNVTIKVADSVELNPGEDLFAWQPGSSPLRFVRCGGPQEAF
jgi:hypothetical protein